MFDFLSQKFSGVLGWLKDRGRLTEENINQAIGQVREALLEADVPLSVVEDFLAQIKNEIVGDKVQSALNPGQQCIKIVHDKVLDFLGGKNALPPVAFQIPSIIMVMGLQGSGKTTSVAKIAYWLIQQAKSRGKQRRVLFASVDFYRPAAVEQLEILAKNIDVHFYRASSQDPVKAAKEIKDYFKKNGYEFLFLDTAGRLHIDDTMMQELKSVERVVDPQYKFLVLDAMTGQESLSVAKSFNQAIGFNSVVLTKMDSDARGGAAFAFKYAIGKPITFVGSGEKVEDLELFIPERMVSRILGMGDIMTLIEKASEGIDNQQQETMSKRMLEGHFSLKDFADQIDMVNKIGSLQKISRYLPGSGQISEDAMEKGQVEIKKFRAIISSMTPKEQLLVHVLDGSRKKRIARGAGVTVEDVNQLLQRFEQSKQFVKMMKKNGMFGSLLRGKLK
ncbi:MAG: signal recognition particle protein [bacterium]